jgi:hypothetical protein
MCRKLVAERTKDSNLVQGRMTPDLGNLAAFGGLFLFLHRVPKIMRNKVLAVLIAAVLAGSFTAIPARAQRAPLPFGSVTGVNQLQSCPTGFSSGMSCFQAQMSCPNTDNIGFTYGFQDPAGNPSGTIVFLEGGDGTSASGSGAYNSGYLDNGFRIVELAWDTAWELANASSSTSIKAAGCRPATFLNYVFQNLYRGGGMCAQGDSAGSGAAAYSLAWYGAANFLDKVELLSGPVFGDIEQNCMVPNAPISTVCGDGQLGCNGAPWPDSPAYVGGDNTYLNNWTDDPTCNGGTTTSQASNQRWKAMSIVDGTDDPSFSYPQTAMAGWLCSNVDTIQNNSAAQGEFFYDQFTSFRQTAGYSVTRIDHCSGAEGVEDGVTPQGVMGLTAISRDMIAGCFKRFRH